MIGVLADVCDLCTFNIEGLDIDVPTDVTIDRLSDVMADIGIGMLTDGVIIVVTPVVLDLKFAVSVSYAVDVRADAVMDADVSIDVAIEALSGAFAGAMTGFVTAGLLYDVNANTLSMVMTDLEFITMSASLKDSLLFC